TAPAAPSNLAANALDPLSIQLTWSDNSNNESGFLIERSTNGTTFTQIDSVGAGVTTYADSGLTANTQYTYRVRATNSVGDSTYTNTASATTPAPDVTPPVISAVQSSVTSNSATITWTTNEPSTSQVNYGFSQIYAANGQDSSFVTAHSVTLSG